MGVRDEGNVGDEDDERRICEENGRRRCAAIERCEDGELDRTHTSATTLRSLCDMNRHIFSSFFFKKKKKNSFQ
jgi:hypothetical protein